MNAEKLKVQLQGDHGELWEAVQRVVLGGAATSPEDHPAASSHAAARQGGPLALHEARSPEVL
eukprot:11185836-Lingulodinium_polyedra.AAC.1